MFKLSEYPRIYVKLKLFAWLLLLFVIFSPGITRAQVRDITWDISNINDVLRMAAANYVDSVDISKLSVVAIKSILKELDPYSFYIPPQQKKSNDETFSGQFEGIGIQFAIMNDTINVISAISGGPSKELGILPGDKIVIIDSADATNLTNEDVIAKLKGPKGTKVSVEIKREGTNGLLHFEIIRDKIPIFSVDAAVIVPKTDIGYISLSKFIATTHSEISDSLRMLKNRGMKRLILDLRGNPGGYMDQAIAVVNEFVPAGSEIVSTKGRNTALNQTVYAGSSAHYLDLPLIILIDAGSASASEIVAGAIQDLDRGLIVGETSFGKGLVQRQYDLDGGAAFRLTTSKYFTPSGRCIQRDYKDEKRWKEMTDRLDLQEGDNLNHELERLEKQSEGDTNTFIFKTKNGRKVLGGGGISPDFVVKYDTLTPLFRQLRSKNIFYHFSSAYLTENKTTLTGLYKNNFDLFNSDFNLTNNNIDLLKKLAQAAGVEWNDEDFKKDSIVICTLLKANIAKNIWDNNEYQTVLITTNKQAMKAIELFPSASKFLK